MFQRLVRLTSSIPSIRMDGHTGPVNGKLLKVGSAVSIDLRVEIREQSSLQKRVLCKVDTAYNMANLILESMSAHAS